MIIRATKLKERGLPASKIRQFCHMQGSPFFQTTAKGSWYVDEDKFDKWLDKLAAQKEGFIYV